MDVIAVSGRVVHLLLAALPVVADRVGLEAAVAGVPALAVPDDLLDAHAARERVHVAELVGREQQVDDALRLTLLPRIVHVEVPVDRAALRVQAGGVLPPLLAAHDSPEGAAGVLGQPVLEGDGSARGALAAARRGGRSGVGARDRRGAGGAGCR